MRAGDSAGDVELIHFAWTGWTRNQHYMAGFASALQTAMEEDANFCSAIVEAMAKGVTGPPSPEDEELFQNTRTSNFVHWWQEHGSIHEFWRLRDHGYPTHAPFAELAVELMPAASAQISSIIASVENPWSLKWLFSWTQHVEDPDRLKLWITYSPQTFDSQGQWDGKPLIFALLAAAEDLIWRVSENRYRGEPPIGRNSDIPDETILEAVHSWVQESAGLVMQRSDAREIGAWWALMKMEDARLESARAEGKPRGPQALVTQNQLARMVIDALRDSGLPSSALHDLKPAPLPGLSERVNGATPNPLHRIAVEVLLAEEKELSEDSRDRELWESFVSLLRNQESRDLVLHELKSPHQPGASIAGLVLGWLLAQKDDPIAAFLSAWRSLGEQRRAAIHYSARYNNEALTPSLALLCIVCEAAILPAHQNEPFLQMHRDIWRTAFRALREMRSSVNSHTANDCDHMIRYMASFVTRLTADLSEQDETLIQEILDFRDDIVIADIVAHIVANGGNDWMRRACGEHPAIEQSLKRFCRWNTLEREVRRKDWTAQRIDEVLAA